MRVMFFFTQMCSNEPKYAAAAVADCCGWLSLFLTFHLPDGEGHGVQKLALCDLPIQGGGEPSEQQKGRSFMFGTRILPW